MDMFDWTRDFLILPEVPTALVGYAGRLYAFSLNNLYRIDPNTFYIEDTHKGMGISDSRSVITTEVGMVFANKNNVYVHTGSSIKPLANAILKSPNSNGYQDLYTEATPPIVGFDPMRNSFLIYTQNASNRKIWIYNLNQSRWDLASYDSDTQVISLFISNNVSYAIYTGSLYSFGTGSSRKAWTWNSKDIIVGQSTQDKKFYEVNRIGDATVTVKNADNDSTITVFPAKAKKIKLEIAGTSSQYIESLGVIFRGYLKLFEGTS